MFSPYCSRMSCTIRLTSAPLTLLSTTKLKLVTRTRVEKTPRARAARVTQRYPISRGSTGGSVEEGGIQRSSAVSPNAGTSTPSSRTAEPVARTSMCLELAPGLHSAIAYSTDPYDPAPSNVNAWRSESRSFQVAENKRTQIQVWAGFKEAAYTGPWHLRVSGEP
jgi:hypothetical protein